MPTLVFEFFKIFGKVIYLIDFIPVYSKIAKFCAQGRQL